MSDAIHVPERYVVYFTPAATGSGPLAAVEAKDGAAFVGVVLIAGILGPIEVKDTATFAGGVTTFGVLDASESLDIFAGVGDVLIGGLLAVTEAKDTAAMTGTSGAPSGGAAEKVRMISRRTRGVW
ncbi:MAG TPA: hypothetical protein VIV12_18540 [Streptosporangiaceae bacterium]